MDDETEERPENEGEKRSALIQSVSIAARFLNLLSRSDTGLALGELAKRAGTGRSTAHRYMQSLVREGLVIQDPQAAVTISAPQRWASASAPSDESTRSKPPDVR